MSTVVYISYTGLSEPLGESQVLGYLTRLAQRHRVTLISFEKPAYIEKPGTRQRLQERCSASGICWKEMKYHSRPGLLATLFDVLLGTIEGYHAVKRTNADVVHARSYVPGAMALVIKRLSGARFVFDMRGFWPDERVDGGLWSKDSVVYVASKWLEKRLFLGADHVVSLTRAGVREFSNFDYLRSRVPPVTIIPTCTDLESFKLLSKSSNEPLTLGYLGSAGTWYMFPEVARAVRVLFELKPESRFLIVNRSEHDYIRSCLVAEGVDCRRVDIVAATYQEVPNYLIRLTAAIFFIKPMFSKRASCPTRLAEFLGSGIPCLANQGVGDVAEDLAETKSGVTIERFDDEAIRKGLSRLLELASEVDIATRCRAAAEERFSLGIGVQRYDRIYRSLARPTADV